MSAFGAVIIALVASSLMRRGSETMDRNDKAKRDVMRALIRVEARRQGVPEHVALAFARVESNFDPLAKGDLEWHKDRARYERVVPYSSPFFDQPKLWHSYGLYQLLAPYHLSDWTEDPRVLYDARTNAQRGIATIKRLLTRYAGSVDKARLAYTGALKASPETQARILEKLREALAAEGRN